MDTMPLIRLEGIIREYDTASGTLRALDGISADIDSGEFVAITGRSGSGKSTLMNILGCLDSPSSGKYYLCGEDVSLMSSGRLCTMRRDFIGFVFQSFNLVNDLTAVENVELPMLYRRVPRKKRRDLALAALDKVGLSGRETHKPRELSGGQQQRVAIARAVAGDPRLILADEPTGSLDRASGEEVLLTLRELNSGGVTVVLITHDISIAERADRIMTVSDGKLTA